MTPAHMSMAAVGHTLPAVDGSLRGITPLILTSAAGIAVAWP